MVLIDFLISALKWFCKEIVQDIFRGKKLNRKADDPPAVLYRYRFSRSTGFWISVTRK
jgi:hypothetical protein